MTLQTSLVNFILLSGILLKLTLPSIPYEFFQGVIILALMALLFTEVTK